MVIKVGINGFGRIGRVLFRTCLRNPEIELSAINDPAIDIEYICYLIKFDSTHGKFKENISHTENEIIIDGKLIYYSYNEIDRQVKVFRGKHPHNVPWHAAGVQYVIEASGTFTCLDKASGHLASDGVKRVIVTAPSSDVPMIILGVNDNTLNAEQKVLSCGSSTLYCLAPIVKVLEKNFGVSEGFITIIHAMTSSLKPLDGLCLRGKHWRDHRSIHQNIIPASTAACKALAKIIPEVKDKMTGLAFRVPIVNVSVLDLTIRLDTNTNLQDIIKSVEIASKSFLQNIIKISKDEAVSSDFSRDSHSCILDASSSLELKPNFYKIVCWYENEYSYACRVLETICFSEKQFTKTTIPSCKITHVRAKLTKEQDEVQQTNRNSKEMSIERNYNAETRKILSQETTFKRKQLIRPVVLRNPLSSHSSGTTTNTAPAVNRDTKKRNELFKIWNDNIDVQKNAARPNRSSFFHSCTAFEPKNTENTYCMKAQERLENVKREFSKMVNITKDLLKKTNANKLQLGTSIKSSLEVTLGSNGGPKEFKPDKPCGDFKNRVVTSPATDSSTEVRCCCSSERNESNSDYIADEFEKYVGAEKSYLAPFQEKTCFKQNSIMNSNQNNEEAQNNFTAKANEPSKKRYQPINRSMNFQGQMTRTVNNNQSIDLFNNSIVQCVMKEHKIIAPKFFDNVVMDSVKQKKIKVTDMEGGAPDIHRAKKAGINTTQTLSLNVSKKPDPSEKSNYRQLNKYLHTKDYNMQVIDEELQKRNIVLVNRQKENNSEVNLKSIDSEQEIGETHERRINLDLSKSILESSNRLDTEPEKITTDTTDDNSECCNPGEDVTISSGDRQRMKPDLYDKLDSASATDSNNSFEINQKTSQIIQICDLTNSLEDLTRLDKICRIIEISDELSDKLFSPLDQLELTGFQQNKWSFKDLCERIQLDDFCNKVFGKQRAQ